MRLGNADQRSTTHRAGRWYALWCVLLAVSASAPALGRSVSDASTALKIDVVRDRMTLALTHYPQVYLHGDIDADAPQRFAALMSSGAVAVGSDIYLNARGGDRAAGMALGRMFRAAGMATHLGTPRMPKQASVAARTAVCVDACAYAWLGGLYRWAPSGLDRIGFTSLPSSEVQGSTAVTAYLTDMGIDPGAFAPTASASSDGMLWMIADQMTASDVANNGELPTTASYNLSSPAPTLELRQVDRRGTHRLTIECRPGKTTVTAYDDVGLERARQIVQRGTSSYFQVGENKVLGQPRDGAQVADNALMIRRDYPPADLVDLVSAWSFGAWVEGRSEAFRDGFTMPLHPVHPQLKVFYYACWKAAPWPPRQKKPR